jgi:hypothetical protein
MTKVGGIKQTGAQNAGSSLQEYLNLHFLQTILFDFTLPVINSIPNGSWRSVRASDCHH